MPRDASRPVSPSSRRPSTSTTREWYRTRGVLRGDGPGVLRLPGSGAGDLRGLVERLDYLQWLGIDCLWLPPFYASPLRDGGYDVSDYTAVLPEFGTMPDFTELVAQAHARGIRIVIVDLVMNHTSDQHPWFQASRADPEGPYGDFYVWTDNDEQYQDARIIFVDTETSNWTFDPVRRQYFWHRFFCHQPDLNFENPRVLEAMFDVGRFWLDLGRRRVPARRRAVPVRGGGHQLREPPATHEFLRQLRAMVSTRSSRAGSCWPRPTSGPRTSWTTSAPRTEPECHMCFHFPVMPRHLLLRSARRSAAPIIDDPGRHPADPGRRPVGHLPAQPRRAHPGDGLHRGARGHVRLVRARPADARERRHPAAARAAAGQLPQGDRAGPRAAAVAAGHAVPVLRRRDRHGRQHLAARPRRGAHADAVDAGPQRRASPPSTRASSTCR